MQNAEFRIQITECRIQNGGSDNGKQLAGYRWQRADKWL
jgi:hypothetical protein